MEQWKVICDFPDYEASSEGNIREKNTGKGIKQHANQNGYKMVWVYIDGKRTRKYVHRLVALAFLGSPHNNEEVNHKNGIRSDNNINNLEWVTHIDNIRQREETRQNIKNTRLNLRILRVRNNLTQEEMAKITGVNRMTYVFIENGERMGKMQFWLMLQKKFDIPDEEMFVLMKTEE